MLSNPITNEDITNDDEDITNDDEDITNEDIEWVSTYREEQNNYKDFYKENVISIRIYFIYINNKKEVIRIGKTLFFLEKKGIITKDSLVSLIKENQTHNKIKYNYLSLYKFNININPSEIQTFIEKTDDEEATNNTYSRCFFTQETYMNDIEFNPTINIMQDLNALYFLFCENSKSSNTIINNHQNNHQNTHTRRKERIVMSNKGYNKRYTIQTKKNRYHH
jgi:hypothetical protein